MMLKSEIAGGVTGRSATNLTHDDHVNDQNSHRYDRENHDRVNVIIDRNAILIPTNGGDSLGDQRDQCQTDDDFLRSGSRTQLYCLITVIV